MGLDDVELIMAVEDAFDIQLKDDELHRLGERTRAETGGKKNIRFGDFCRLVTDQLRRSERLEQADEADETKQKAALGANGSEQLEVGVSSVVLLEVRCALAEVLGVPLSEVQSDSRLQELIPKGCRREIWRELRLALCRRLDIPAGGRWSNSRRLTEDSGPVVRHRFQIPSLKFGAPWDLLIELAAYIGVMGVVSIAAILVSMPVGWHGYRTAAFYVMALPIIFSWLPGLLVCRTIRDRLADRFARRFPPEFQMVEQLADRVSTQNYGAYARAFNRGSSQEVEQVVREIISEHFGIKSGDITPDACLYRDLGLG